MPNKRTISNSYALVPAHSDDALRERRLSQSSLFDPVPETPATPGPPPQAHRRSNSSPRRSLPGPPRSLSRGRSAVPRSVRSSSPHARQDRGGGLNSGAGSGSGSDSDSDTDSDSDSDSDAGKGRTHSSQPEPEPEPAPEPEPHRSLATTPATTEATTLVWIERPSSKAKEEQRQKLATAKKKIIDKEVRMSVGPFAEPTEVKPSKKQIRIGKMRFEETGRVVPYIIIPEQQRDPGALLEGLQSMKHGTTDRSDEDMPLPKPSIIFDVGSSSGSYLSWVNDVRDNDQLRQAWSDSDEAGETTEAAGAQELVAPSPSDFAERLISVTGATLASIEEGGSWLFTPAGRDAAAQLFGSAIERFRGSLDDLIWVQYASLKDKRLFGTKNHTAFVKQLKASSTCGSAKAKSLVCYPSNRMHYPTVENLHAGQPLDNLVDSYESFQQNFDGIDLHPWVSHLVFVDTEGHTNSKHMANPPGSLTTAAPDPRLDPPLPHDHIHALKQAMAEQAVSQGMILIKGGERELIRARKVVEQLSPILTFKNVGGASEVMSRSLQLYQRKKQLERYDEEIREEQMDVRKAFEELTQCLAEVEVYKRREKLEKASSDKNRPHAHTVASLRSAEARLETAQRKHDLEKEELQVQIDKIRQRKKEHEERWEEEAKEDGYDNAPCKLEALDESLQKWAECQIRPQADPEEMVIVDVVPNNKRVHTDVHKQMLLMKGKQVDTQERTTHGYEGIEGKLIDKTWEHAAIYRRNMSSQEKRAFLLDLLTNVFNVLIVLIVVLKQWWYPPAGTESTAVTREEHNYDDEPLFDGLTAFLILMPIINGVFITLASQLDPVKKRDALAWADAALESETYKYRTRTQEYSRVTDAAWRAVSDSTGALRRVKKTLPTTIYRERCECINDALYSDSTFQLHALVYEDDPCCSYIFGFVSWCWTDGTTDLVTGLLFVGIAVLGVGFVQHDFAFNIRIGMPFNHAGQVTQLVGAILTVIMLVLSSVVSIAQCALTWALKVILAVSSLFLGYDLVVRGWSFNRFDFASSRGTDDDSIDDRAKEQTTALFLVAWLLATWILATRCGADRIYPILQKKGWKCTAEVVSKCTKCKQICGRHSFTAEQQRNERLAETKSRKLKIMSEEIDTRDRKPKEYRVSDNGYSRLDIPEYLACRTQVLLERFKQEVQPLGYKLQTLKICALISTTVSVALGSFNYDIFIAASTALVSFFTAVQESGDYKRRVEHTNLAIKKLQAAEHEWKSLSLAHKSKARCRAKLVKSTEEAAMRLFEVRYPGGPAAMEEMQAKTERAHEGRDD